MQTEMEDARQDVTFDLQVVTAKDTEGVIDRLEHYLPESSQIRNLLKAWIIYDGIFDLLGTKVFYSHQSTLVVATSLVFKPGLQSIAVFWDKDKEEEGEILRLLSSLPNIDWHLSVFVYVSPLPLVEKIRNFVVNGQLGDGDLLPANLFKVQIYTMTSIPQEIRLPEGFEMRRLAEKHAKLMFDNWQYNHSATLEAYKGLVATLPGIGVFRMAKDKIPEAYCGSPPNQPVTESSGGTQANQESLPESSDDDLVSWTQLSILTNFTNTFTLPQYRRLGLGTAATLALAKKSIEDLGMASVGIVDTDHVSIQFHKKLGFTRQCAMGLQRMEKNIK